MTQLPSSPLPSLGRRYCGLLPLLAALLWTPALLAQDTAAVHSEGVDPLSASPVQAEQAQTRFYRAKALFDSQDFAAALVEFRASRAIVASPNSRLYMARCLRSLNRLVQAYALYGRTLIEALELARHEARYGRTAEAARSERAELQQNISLVKVTLLEPRPQTALLVNGEEIRRSAWGESVVVMPGTANVVVRTPGVAEQRSQATLEPGNTWELTLRIPEAVQSSKRPAPKPSISASVPREPSAPEDNNPGKLRSYAYGAAALSLTGMGAFGIFGALSADTHAELEKKCTGGGCPAEQQPRIKEGRRQQLFANVGLGVGVTSGAAALTLWLLSNDEPTSVSVLISPTGLYLRGRL